MVGRPGWVQRHSGVPAAEGCGDQQFACRRPWHCGMPPAGYPMSKGVLVDAAVTAAGSGKLSDMAALVCCLRPCVAPTCCPQPQVQGGPHHCGLEPDQRAPLRELGGRQQGLPPAPAGEEGVSRHRRSSSIRGRGSRWCKGREASAVTGGGGAGAAGAGARAAADARAGRRSRARWLQLEPLRRSMWGSTAGGIRGSSAPRRCSSKQQQ